MPNAKVCLIILFASAGMFLCQAGLVIGIVNHGYDPYHWKDSIDQLSERIVIVQGRMEKKSDALRTYALALGAAALFAVAVLNRNPMYALLEGFLTPSALISLIHWGPEVTIPLRLLLSALTFYLLIRMKLLEKVTWEQIRRGEIPPNWYGGAGIESLGVGHISTLSHFHLIGGILLSIYSWLGWKCGPLPSEKTDEETKSRQRISLFWLFLNVPFAALAGFEAYLQTVSL